MNLSKSKYQTNNTYSLNIVQSHHRTCKFQLLLSIHLNLLGSNTAISKQIAIHALTVPIKTDPFIPTIISTLIFTISSIIQTKLYFLFLYFLVVLYHQINIHYVAIFWNRELTNRNIQIQILSLRNMSILVVITSFWYQFMIIIKTVII